MANKVKKTKSKLDFSIVGIVQNDINGTHEIEFKVKNPVGGKASIKNLRYLSPDDNTYYNAILYSTQLNSFDKDSFDVNPKYVKYKIVWDSIADMKMHQNFESVVIELTLADEINGGGTNSESLTMATPVKFKVSEVYKVTKPRSNQNDLTFQFFTPKLLRDAKVHYIIKVDTIDTFNSTDLKTFDTQIDRNGWTYKDGNTLPSFPEFGVDGGPNTQKEIFLNDSTLNALAQGDYFFQVQPIPSQFIAQISNPTSGSVFNTTTITISGTLTNY